MGQIMQPHSPHSFSKGQMNMAKPKYTSKVVAIQGNGHHISTGSANGGPTLAELCSRLGGEAGTTLANSATPPSIPAPSKPRFPLGSVGICVVLMIILALLVVLP